MAEEARRREVKSNCKWMKTCYIITVCFTLQFFYINHVSVFKLLTVSMCDTALLVSWCTPLPSAKDGVLCPSCSTHCQQLSPHSWRTPNLFLPWIMTQKSENTIKPPPTSNKQGSNTEILIFACFQIWTLNLATSLLFETCETMLPNKKLFLAALPPHIPLNLHTSDSRSS